jgi:hypothetical protein
MRTCNPPLISKLSGNGIEFRAPPADQLLSFGLKITPDSSILPKMTIHLEETHVFEYDVIQEEIDICS